MNISTHLVLVSAQPIPNLSPILDETLRPQKVVMLVSADMQERSQALENIYKPRGISVERCLIDDPWNPEHISLKVQEIIDPYPIGSIALNATGGTKLMSIAAYEVFREYKQPIFYIHPEKDQLIWLSPKQAGVELADRIKLKDYLMAYGAELVEIPDSFGVKPNIRQLTDEILKDIDRYAGELGTLNYLALKADNPQLSVEIQAGPLSNPNLWQLLDLFADAGLCTINGNSLNFIDENARFIANGGWLEQHTYGLCVNLKAALGIQDVAKNISITRQPAGPTVVKNEIDIGLINNNRLHIIECKTKRYKDDTNADVLYKLDSLRDLMGGLQSRAMLVSFNMLDKPSRARAAELKIQLCCQSELQNLRQHLQQWLNNAR